jgi:transcriptional accessory protein Tex/SPT6
VLEVDLARKRIALTMKSAAKPGTAAGSGSVNSFQPGTNRAPRQAAPVVASAMAQALAKLRQS